jgi:hypothetical protein
MKGNGRLFRLGKICGAWPDLAGMPGTTLERFCLGGSEFLDEPGTEPTESRRVT